MSQTFVIQEVCSIYQDKGDQNRLLYITNTEKLLKERHEQESKELKEILEELNSRLEFAKQQSKRPEPLEQHLQRVSILKSELDQLINRIQQDEQKFSTLQKSTKSMQQELQKMLETEEQESQQHKKLLQRNATCLALHHNVAPITWEKRCQFDHHSQQQQQHGSNNKNNNNNSNKNNSNNSNHHQVESSQTLKGFFSFQNNKNQLHSFQLSLKDPYRLTQDLWGMIDSHQQERT